MSQPPPMPNDPFAPSSLNYFPPDSSRPAGLVRLAVIFNYITVALDILLALCLLGLSVLFTVGGIPQNPGDPPPVLLAVIYGGMGLVTLGVIVFKFIALSKIKGRKGNAAGWGLALGIIGTIQFLTGSCLCLQVAAGVYTLVIMCRQDVKYYLSSPSQPPA